MIKSPRMLRGYATTVAAHATHQVALRRGRELGMWVGCGFPKSGTVWLCQLMSTYLGLPYPRLYSSPISMAAVIHAHWRYDERLPPTLYIARDGRDVLLSFYFHCVRALQLGNKPRQARDLHAFFTRLYGPQYDLRDVRGNLPKFLDAELTDPKWSHGLAWHLHLREWEQRPNVGYVTYEGLKTDPVRELVRSFGEVTRETNTELAELAARRWSFEVTTGRKPGEESRDDFQRKGIVGDWRNHFSRAAGEAFAAHAGEVLIDHGYENDHGWLEELER